MSFNTALDSTKLEYLRGTSALNPSFVGETYISLCPNTTVFKSTLSATPASGSFASIQFGAVISGSSANIKVGQTVIISATDDQRAAVFVGRVRSSVVGAVLYINETSASISAGYYLWVIDDYRIWDVLPRQNNGTPNMDYDVTFRQLKPVFYGVDSDFAAYITGASKTYSFPVTITPSASGATISSFSWDIGDGSLVSGSLSGSGTSATMSASFPAGFRHVHLTATDSNGVSNVLHLRVYVHSSAYPAQLLTHGDVQIDGDIEGGFSASVTAFAELSSVLDNTALTVWTIDNYNGTETSIASNIAFVGRLRNANDVTSANQVFSVHQETRLTIESPLQQLARINIVSYELRDNASPSIFGDIKNLTIWRGVVFMLSEMSTFTSLHALSFDSTADTFRFFGTATPAGNILNAVNDLGDSINASFQMNAAGRSEVVRDLRMESTANRNAAVTVFGHTTSDIVDVERTHQHVRTVGKLEASGGAYNTTSRAITAVFSLAPGVAQDYPEGSSNLARQVLTANVAKALAESELNTRSGHAFEKAQQADTISVTYLPGYWWLTPARNQWYTFTLSSSDTVSGLALTTATRWLCTSVSVTHQIGDGSKQVQATFTKETSGAAGQTVSPPDIGEVPYEPPIIPTLPVYPAFPVPMDPIFPPGGVPYTGGTPPTGPIVARTDGNVLVYFDDDDRVFVTRDGLMGRPPTWTEITPTLDDGYTLKDIEVINRQLLMVANNGTQTIVYNRPSFFDPSQAATQGDPIVGVFEQIRRAHIAGTAGAAYIAGEVEAGTGTEEFDFTTSASGWSFRAPDVCATQEGTWLTGTGYSSVVDRPFDSGGGDCTNWSTRLVIDHTFSSRTITSITVTYDYTAGSVFNADDRQVKLLAGTSLGTLSVLTSNAISSGTNLTLSWTGSATYAAIEINIWASGTRTGSIGSDGSCVVKSVEIEYSNAFTGIATAYSDDYFETSEAPREVGTAAADRTGLATIKAGQAVVAGMLASSKIATTAGGAYSNYGTLLPTPAYPMCLAIPRNAFGSTSSSNINTSTPEYLAVSGTLAGGSLSMWKITGSGGTLTSITPSVSGTYGLAVSPHCADMSDGQKIVSVLVFNGTRKLAVSVDTGATWRNTVTNVSALADYVALNRADRNKKQLFFANGTQIGYVSNYQSATLTVANIAAASSATILGVKVYSGN